MTETDHQNHEATPPVSRTASANRSSDVETQWWNRLRVRFGILLALALLPWLLLTVLGAVDSADRSKVSRVSTADIVAKSTVSEISLILESGRLGLDAAPGLIARDGCTKGATGLLDRLSVYKALVVQNSDGDVICQSPTRLTGLSVVAATPFDEPVNFRIERGTLGVGADAETVVVLQNRITATGAVYTLVLPKTLGLREVLDVTLGEAASVALNKSDSSRIIGSQISDETSDRLTSLIGTDAPTLIDYTSDTLGERRIASQYLENLGVYVTVGRDNQPDRFRDLINPYTAVFLPILAWLVGFGLIWLGTRSLLLTPIAKVRRAARQYADGALETRIELTDAAAGEVQGLASTFNRMATELQDRDTRLADNIDEKDTLMREIHHRVKNNLQIIISLLNMQERKAESVEASNAIVETRARINAIAIVHRGLYESDDLRTVRIGPFITRLLGSLEDTLGLRDAGIGLSHNLDDTVLTADNAIPIALFIVEAVSNAVAHGVDRDGKVDVSVRLLEGEQTPRLSVSIADNGCGVPDPSEMRGIGSRLMKGFGRQLGGEVKFTDNDPGFRATLTISHDVTDFAPFKVRQGK